MKKTWKRVISLLLVVCMMTTFAATAAFDDEVFAETPAGEEAVDLFAADTERSEMPLYTEATADLSAADGTYTWVNHDRAIEYPRTQTTAWSDSEQSGYGPALMLDGNNSTKWEAAWNGAPERTTITLELPQAEYVTGFMYTSRQDNNIGGAMTEYSVLSSTDGNHAPVTEGTLPRRLGTFYVTFDEPVQAKYVQIVSDAKAITEMRLTYLPGDYAGLLAAAKAERAAVTPGSDIGQWNADTLTAFDEGLTAIEESGKTDREACAALVTLIRDLKRGQSASTSELAAAYRQANTLLTAADVGQKPLQWPQDAVDAFAAVLEKAAPVATSATASKGAVLDAQKALEEGLFTFRLAQVRPAMSTTLLNQNLGGLMDGVTESRYGGQDSGTDNKYIELDYQNEVQFESLTLYSWWANQQAPKSIRVAVKVGDTWQDVDGGTAYALNWTTYVGTSEKQSVTFATPVKGTALRIYIVTPGTQSPYVGIDELEVGIGVDEADMSIALDRDTLSINEGQSVQLTATVLPAHATNKNVNWSSSDPTAVSVSGSGLVTGIALPAGESSKTVTITATTEYGAKTDTCIVTLLPVAATEEDKVDATRRLEILEKLAKASKAEDYDDGSLDTVNAAIEGFKTRLADENLTVGGVSVLNGEIQSAKATFEAASRIPLRTVAALIDRVTGTGSSARFTLEIIPADPETGMDAYEVDWDGANGKPVLRGNNAVALATAYNYYLKYFAYLDFPYVGDCDMTLPSTMPVVAEKVRIVFPYQYRHYFNENCEYKYTTILYSEEEWAHRLDWLAMNGFNMFLLDMGGGAVWQDAAVGMKIPDNVVEKYLSSNSRETAMAKFVAQRGMDLGMEPEIRPFAGGIPFMFENNYDDYYGANYKPEFVIEMPGSILDGVTIYTGARWMNQPSGLYLSPEVAPNSGKDAQKAKEVFQQVSDIYYASLTKVLGFDEYGRTPALAYVDMVGEQGFVVQHPAFPQKVISEMVDDLLGLNPDAIWMQTSWRYSSWLVEQYQPGSLMFVDLKADNNPKWNSSDEFGGTPWLWSMLFNFGGNTGLGGDLKGIPEDIMEAKAQGRYMSGVAIAPEGGDTNPALYAMMAEMTWRDAVPDMEQWLKDYAKCRYGAENYALAQMELDQVWQQLYQTVYSGNCPGGADGPSQTLINASPKLTGAIARVYGTNNKVYATRDIIPIWKTLLDAADAIQAGGGTLTEQFKYDLVDITRQALGDISGDVYAKINPAYQTNNKEDTLKYAGLMVDLCRKMDDILSTNRFFLIGPRLEGAKNRGETEADKNYFEKMERTFLTYWIMDNYDAGKAGGLIDYCNRHLAGLMTDYYGMRWQKFYDELDRAMTVGSGQYNQSTVDSAIKTVVTAWTEEHTPYTTTASGDPVEVSRAILVGYAELLEELYPDKSDNLAYRKPAVQNMGNAAETGVDGDTQNLGVFSKGGLAPSNLPLWWKVDLGKVYNVHTTKLYFSTRNDYFYQIEYSTAENPTEHDVSWTILADYTETPHANTPDAPHVEELEEPVQARHLRVTLTAIPAGTEIWPTFTEFEVYGTDPADADAVSAAAAALTWDAIKNQNQLQTEVKTDLTLPLKGEGETKINWSSSHPDVISAKGIVTRPADADATVTLTATITKGTAQATKEFELTVKQNKAVQAAPDRSRFSVTDADEGQNNGAITISSDVDKLEYRVKPVDGADPAYTNATATIGNLSAGWYQFRYKETDTHYASDITEVEIRILSANAKDLTISEEILHGSVTAVRKKVNPGDTVKLTVTPDLGYELTAITANYGDSQSVTPTWNEETGTYNFTMPDAAVNVTATFALITYTIDYQWEGVADGSFTVEDTSIMLTTAERDDYTFAGWSLTENGAVLSDVTAAMLIAGAENKIVKLYPVWELIPADKDALAAAIEAAEAVKNDNYTTVSWNAFQKALSDAKDVLANAEATQTETDSALAALTVAQNGLKKQSSGGFGSSRPSTSTEVTTNPDGSKTTTVTDNRTGTVTATTEKPDGTVEVVETKKDGTVTETVTTPDGTKSETITTKDGDVTITVTDPEGEEIIKVELPAAIPAPETRFDDVPEGHWADEAIHNAAALKLVEGVGDNKYDMVSPMTRGALATVLHRLSQGKTDYEVTFKDVAQGKYYTEGVAWAAKTGVVKGFSEDIFAPEQVITREQLAVMLCRYAKLIGLDTKANSKLLDQFTDGDTTGDWAVDGVAWCVENGILKGKGQNNLDPTAKVTRAEVAVMLDRFIALLK